MSTSLDPLTIGRRFAGPPSSGNGGYTAGLLASQVTGSADGPVTVTLRRPPPLERPLGQRLLPDKGLVRLLAGGDGEDGDDGDDGDEIVAEAGPGAFADEAVEPVPLDQALAAESAYRGLHRHPFPTCFVCGTARQEGDGMRLRPGLFAAGRTACVWTPHESLAEATGLVSPVFAWAALDCPGGWTSDLEARPLVLGRMTARCDAPVTAGTPYVVVARLLDEQGRKTRTASAVYDVMRADQPRRVGRAEHVWIAVDPARFG